ncbi:MAG: glutathione S-transferase N-terminal domain-containing protein [Pseudomonadota bacterium]
MARRLFEVAGKDDDFRLSPYCWRTRMALAHKGLPFTPVPWRIVEKDRIARSGGGTAPVLVDGERWLRESFEIAIYLDEHYPDRPALFRDEGERATARLVDAWVSRELHPIMFRAVVSDQIPLLADKDQAFYRQRNIEKFGTTLAELGAHPDAAIETLQPRLAPLEAALSDHAFLGGTAPRYVDYIAFGAFQWARVASTRRLYPPESPIGPWFERLLSAFDGFAARQPSRAYWKTPATPDEA